VAQPESRLAIRSPALRQLTFSEPRTSRYVHFTTRARLVHGCGCRVHHELAQITSSEDSWFGDNSGGYGKLSLEEYCRNDSISLPKRYYRETWGLHQASVSALSRPSQRLFGMQVSLQSLLDISGCWGMGSGRTV